MTVEPGGADPVRLMRLSPWVHLNVVSQACGVSSNQIVDRLGRTRNRGRCVPLIAAAFTRLASADADRLLSDERCPPPITRRQAAACYQDVGWAGRGAAAWVGRGATHRSPARWVLVQRARSDDLGERCGAASHGACPAATLTALTRDADPTVRAATASNPGLSPRLVHVLAADPDVAVRHILAGASRDPAVISAVHQDLDHMVRAAVAQNPHTPARVLHALARDGRNVVRQYVARNDNTPTEVLTHLAMDTHVNVNSAAIGAIIRRGATV